MTDHITIRTVTLRSLPLLAIGLPASGPGAALTETARAHGLTPLPAVLGAELPRGARVGFVVDDTELRLRDEHDTTLLRAPRAGLDPDWQQAAVRLRGTMTVLVSDLELDAHASPEELLLTLDAAARAGRASGAIVGLVEERPTLPLLLG